TTLSYLGNGDWSFSATHQYLDDNPTNSVSRAEESRVGKTDDDTGTNANTKTTTVSNVAPTSIVLRANSVNENGTVTLTGSFHDDGTQDTHTIVIDWNALGNVGPGEGTTTLTTAGPNPAGTTLTYLGNGDWSFSATHQYLDDNPTNSVS